MSNEHSHHHGSGHEQSVRIVINGQQFTVDEKRISYDEVVRLAFPGGPFDITYAVDYINEHGPDGTLTQGQDVKVHEGMIFNVIKTNRS
ncbi:hypothetical protein BI364_12900 [Acidihalobacter yilgarnensis]|uniref:Multi-ubiquitin domain-containing protein n=1 Tax=Acidihalobacter yilgarnensis TaxID=2819280 RepID=A0A1D8IQR5_9GAMM|nr:multiubiquitin domain-containing protein [Acidihalobacter yilgarnensis]AOU98743.1 hypothetical protein BI364_12900 [Acidihalobacter yilgarnensis]